MPYSLESIKQKIDQCPKIYWFLIKKGSAKVLVKGETMTETRERLDKIISKNGDKYEGEFSLNK